MENGPSFLVHPVKYTTTMPKPRKHNGTNLKNGTGSKFKSIFQKELYFFIHLIVDNLNFICCLNYKREKNYKNDKGYYSRDYSKSNRSYRSKFDENDQIDSKSQRYNENHKSYARGYF